MTKDEALRLALEFIASINPAFTCEAIHHSKKERHEIFEPCPHVAKQKQVYESIKAALEANEFNPDWDTQAVFVEEIQRMAKRIEELEAKDEPVEFFDWYDNAHWGNEDFKEGCHRAWNAAIKYTTPPQRTWVGLTDEEIVLIVAECAASHQHTDIHFARAIEAKLRSKNT